MKMLKNKFTFMLVNRISNKKQILSFIFVLLFLCNYIMAQTIGKISLNKTKGRTVPTFQHSALTTNDDGFSLLYSINGFAAVSVIGQISLNYKTYEDSYFLATGLANLLGGINKSIFKYKATTLYINGNLGFIFSKLELLYSIGASCNFILGKNSQIEIASDIFSHPGSSYAYAIVNANYTRGVVGSVTYSHNILGNLTTSLTVGIEYMEYRYIEYCGVEDCSSYYYHYISLEEEKNQFFQSMKNKKLKWEVQPIAFPFDITFSYHF